MKNLAISCLTLVCLGILAANAHAFGHRGCGDCPPPCPPKITYVEKVVTCLRPEWKEERVKCVVNKMYCRVQENTVKCTVMVPKWVEVTDKCVYMVPVPKTVEREVVRCRMVPVQMTDECGCAYTCYKPEEYREKVACTVWECKREVRDVVRRVCTFQPQVRDVVQRRLIPECRPETVEYVRRYCVMVPHQVTVRVPVCTPCCP
jgi:hypothetical protein